MGSCLVPGQSDGDQQEPDSAVKATDYCSGDQRAVGLCKKDPDG